MRCPNSEPPRGSTHVCVQPIKHVNIDNLPCWINVGPPSMTVAQH